MRTVAWSLLFLAIVVVASTAPEASAQDKEDVLKRGSNLPGAFHPYNVTGKRAKHFHSLVTQQGLDPGVIVFSTDFTFSDALKDLLKQLDEAIEKNPDERIASFVVFLFDDAPDVTDKDVVFNDSKREEVTANIEALAKELGLKHVVLTLHSRKFLDDYKLADDEATVVLYDTLTIKASHRLPKLTAENVTQIRKEMADALGATRK